jgi:phage terminase large subunit-like protein
MGRLERLAVERMRRDHGPRGARARGFIFDAERGNRVVQFFEEYLHHHIGEWAGKPLLLELWQQTMLREIFGWIRPGDPGTDGRPTDPVRRFREAYIEIPRKDGKSEVGAGVGLYLTVADGEHGAQVYSSATKREQARIVWGTAAKMVEASPELGRFLSVLRSNISCAELGSKFEPLAADSKTQDGLNAHGNIIDEVHAHSDRHLIDVLQTSMGARRQPLTFYITTAGEYNPENIGWILHERAVKVLEGAIEDDSLFALIFAADDEDDYTDPVTWRKANPNLNVSVRESYLRTECEKAKQQPSYLNTFLRYHLNRWTQQRTRWIAPEQWTACDDECSSIEYEAWVSSLGGTLAFGGLDMSTKIDITAFVLAIPQDDELALVARFWCPKERILERARKDRVPYDAWARDGWLIETPGDVVDYDRVRDDIVQLCQGFEVREIGFDPWNATQIATQLGGDGLTMVEVRQGFKSMSEPSKEFEARVVSRRVRHGGHPVLRWMVSNVGLREDANENIMPDKSTQTGRIDGVVASIMALSRLIVDPLEAASVYETQGIRTL